MLAKLCLLPQPGGSEREAGEKNLFDDALGIFAWLEMSSAAGWSRRLTQSRNQ